MFIDPRTNEEDDDVAEEDPFLGFSAVEEACHAGHIGILERLGPDPLRDDFEGLYQRASSPEVVELLIRLVPPRNVGAIIRAQSWYLQAPFVQQRRSIEALQILFAGGVRWEASSPEETADVRRALVRLPNDAFVDIVKLLAKDSYCAPAILFELGRTPAMRARMKNVGFIRSPNENTWDYSLLRPTRAREVCAKFGIALPKVPVRLPQTVYVGKQQWDGKELRLNRTALYERVWKEPVERLAKSWGLSGRGLAKACQRLKIPVPPRGYWMRSRRGRPPRRPTLPALPPGEAEEIVIQLPERGG